MNRNKLVIVTRCAALLAALCFSTVATAQIDVVLKLDNLESPTKLEILSNSHMCDDMILNCIEVKKNTSPNIAFVLPDACEPGASYPQYELSSMRISLIDKKWPSSTDPLNAEVADDFNADRNTGKIDFHVGNNERTNKKMKFKDKNKNPYTIFYEITALPCDDSGGKPIALDPEIRNKG